jgi:protein involved in polysaccharide export with SLBB domain
MTLKDVILQSGGFTEGANLREVEVTRMVEQRGQEGLRATTIRVPLNRGARNVDSVSFSVRDTVRALRAADEFTLEHRDRVFVRTDPAFQPQQTVTIRGEVRFPGEYTILRDNERLSDVLRRAGGVLPTGYLKGGRLLRDTDDTGASFRREGEQVIVEMQQAVEGDRDDDVILRPGDEIVIPPQPNTVAIRGNVANEGLVKHEPGERVEYYLDRAGGVREDTERILLTQASGATFRVNTGWFRRTPEVDDGAIIRVVAEEPQPEGEAVDVGQIAQESISILSSALTVIVLATRAFN